MTGLYKDGFYKIGEESGCFCTALLYNPETKEVRYECTRDYDYADCSRDNDELYYLPINEDYRKMYLHEQGIILVGDMVEVYKGRKVKIGTIARVTEFRPYKDQYGRTQTTYAYLDNGERTNVDNCRLWKGEQI